MQLITYTLCVLQIPRFHPNCTQTNPFWDKAAKVCKATCDIANPTMMPIQINTQLECDSAVCTRSAVFELIDKEILEICNRCTMPSPFFDMNQYQCSSSCGYKDVFVSPENFCRQRCTGTTTVQSYVYQSYLLNYMICQECYEIDISAPYYLEGVGCSTECNKGTHYTASAYNRTCFNDGCKGQLVQNPAEEWQKCFDCTEAAPYFDGTNCISQCAQTSDDSLICTTCPNSSFYIQKMSAQQLNYNFCIGSCPLGPAPTPRQQYCLTCAEVDPSKPFNNSGVCVDKCPEVNSRSIVDENWNCLTSCSGFIRQLQSQANTTNNFFCFQRSVSNNATFAGDGTPYSNACAKYQSNGKCVASCPLLITGKSVIEPNGFCASYCDGYVVIDAGNNVCYSKCSQKTYFSGSSFRCLQNCQNYVLSTAGERVCYDQSCIAAQIPVLGSSGYPKISCITLSACQAGYLLVGSVCVQTTSCLDYVNRCTQQQKDDNDSQCQLALQSDNQCLSRCPLSKPYANNSVCVVSCKALGRKLASDNKTCTDACQPSEVITTFCPLGEECCGTCGGLLIKDIDKCVSSCPNVRPYNQSSSCASQCDNGQNLTTGSTYQCIDSCDKFIYQHNAPYFNKECVTSCKSTNLSFIDQNKNCVQSCGATDAVISNNSEQFCSKCNNSDYLFNKSCYQSCAAIGLKVEDNTCVSTCTKYNSSHLQNGETVCVNREAEETGLEEEYENITALQKLSAGEIAGITIGILIPIIVVATVVPILMIKKRKNKVIQKNNNPIKKKQTVPVKTAHLKQSIQQNQTTTPQKKKKKKTGILQNYFKSKTDLELKPVPLMNQTIVTANEVIKQSTLKPVSKKVQKKAKQTFSGSNQTSAKRKAAPLKQAQQQNQETRLQKKAKTKTSVVARKQPKPDEK